MFTIGLTGGIGTGKTTVSAILRDLGAEIINADLLGHEVYKPNSDGWLEMIKAFGRGIIDDKSEILVDIKLRYGCKYGLFLYSSTSSGVAPG